ncbi:MAG: Ig-like domain-containing protein, partial [Bacteroidota bacterium]
MIATPTNFFSSTRCKVLVISLFFSLWGYGQQTVITGDLKKFHKVTLTWDAIDTNETAATFTDFRLNVTFTSPSGKTFLVPGYFAADGNAAESSAESGNKWRCHFTALEAGVWSYTVSFRTGQGIALNSDISDGTPVSIDGTNGTFSIAESDKSGKDFRSKGKLEYVGEHFLKWTTGEYFLKTGANSPEVFLEYSEFDNTPRNEKRDFPPRTYAAHIPDWNDGDPIWKTNKGKGIIGAVNYLGEQDVNAHYFLTMSVYGDNDTVFPWITIDDRYVYDISKLDQWQIVFDQMMRKGIMVHFILTEGENQSLFEHFDGGGSFADSRKIYYRELIARFGYLNAITWNIGEENGWNRGSTWGRANTSTQQKNFAAYIKNLLYYNDHITVENGPTSDDSIFNNLLGENSFTGASIQGRYSNVTQGRDRILKWRSQSILNNKNWVVTYDEPYTGGRDMPSQSVIRELVIWGTLTAGGAGYEFYVGSSNGIPMDFRIEDYRPYEAYWTAMRYGKELFIQNDIPFYEMENKDDLVTSGWCLGKDEAYYVIYLADGGSTTITIPGNDDYEVMWYNPRNGGNLSPGTITNISAGTDVSIGLPPSNTDLDWVAVLKADSESTTIAVTGIELSVENETLTIGGTIALEATISPSDATNTGIDWSSSDSNIATVNADGLVTAIAEGQATITATTVDGGFTDTAVITVEESVISVTGLTLSPKTQTLEIGETVTLEATVSPSDATNSSIDWSSDDSNIATVNSEGLITALAEGQATITATTVDGGFNDTAVINVLPVSDGDSMTGFVLVDAGTDQDMLVLTDGLQIDFSEVSGLSLNVR